MPLLARHNVIVMSPELIQKLDSASKALETNNTHQMDTTATTNLVAVLEKKLENAAKDFVFLEDAKLELPDHEHVIYLDVPHSDHSGASSPHNTTLDETDGDVFSVNLDSSFEDSNHISHNTTQDNLDNTSLNLFEVSVDISESPQVEGSVSSCESGEIRDMCIPEDINKRRSSRWSATVLFVASEVQMMVNLARHSPPDGYVMAPEVILSKRMLIKRNYPMFSDTPISHRNNNF